MTDHLVEWIAVGILSGAVFILVIYFIYLAFVRIRRYKNVRRRNVLVEQLKKLQFMQWCDELSTNDSCVMCSETFPNLAEICVFSCRHACHILCAEQYIRRGLLRCPACNAEIIPNTKNYTAADLESSPESSQSQSLYSERRSLLKPSIFQEVFRFNYRRQYLRVPTDCDDSHSSHQKSLDLPGVSKSRAWTYVFSPEKKKKPRKTVRLTTPIENGDGDEYFSEDLDDMNNDEKDNDKFLIIHPNGSPDSVFFTPKTKLGFQRADTLIRSSFKNGSTLQEFPYFTILTKKIKVDIHDIIDDKNEPQPGPSRPPPPQTYQPNSHRPLGDDESP